MDRNEVEKRDPHMLGAAKHERFELEAYDTIEAENALDTLLDAAPFSKQKKILEPCAGRGHLAAELKNRGYEVDAFDIEPREPALYPVKCADIMRIKTLADYGAIITNFPYREQDQILKHILPIANRDGCAVAFLARAAWYLGSARRKAILHDNPYWRAIALLPRRLYWIENSEGVPRHEFMWVLYSSKPREEGESPIIYTPKRRYPPPPWKNASRDQSPS